MRHYDKNFDDFDDMDYVGIRAIRQMIDEDRRNAMRSSGRRHARRFGSDPWEDDDSDAWDDYDDYDDNELGEYNADEFDSYSSTDAEMR